MKNTEKNTLTKFMTKMGITVLVGFIVILVIVLIAPDVIFAQPPPILGDPQQSPIDGGLSVVAVAGGAYALKKLRKKN